MILFVILCGHTHISYFLSSPSLPSMVSWSRTVGKGQCRSCPSIALGARSLSVTDGRIAWLPSSVPCPLLSVEACGPGEGWGCFCPSDIVTGAWPEHSLWKAVNKNRLNIKELTDLVNLGSCQVDREVSPSARVAPHRNEPDTGWNTEKGTQPRIIAYPTGHLSGPGADAGNTCCLRHFRVCVSLFLVLSESVGRSPNSCTFIWWCNIGFI